MNVTVFAAILWFQFLPMLSASVLVPIQVAGSAMTISEQVPSAEALLRNDNQTLARITAEDVFVRATASISNPFVGQHVIITYRLFTRIPVSQFSFEESPGIQGFWAEDITPQGEPVVSYQVVNGIRYTVAVIRQMIAYPQRSGKLSLDPLQVNTLIRLGQPRTSGNFSDESAHNPFTGNFQMVEHSLESNRIQITARPLPEASRPAHFNGVVGRFRLHAALSHDTVRVGEPVTLTVIITGTGNLNVLQMPEMDFGASLEHFGTEVSDDFSSTANGTSGSRKFETVLVPRLSGLITSDTLHFSAFNPNAGRYEDLSKAPLSLVVVGTTDDYRRQGQILGTETVDFLNADIQFIYTEIFPLADSAEMYYKSHWYFGKIGLLWVGFAVFVVLWIRHSRISGNLPLLRHQNANKMAMMRMGNALKALKNDSRGVFFQEVSISLWGYISDKLSIPVSRLSKDEVKEYFEKYHLPEGWAEAFFEAVEQCEFERFAPESNNTDLHHFYKKAFDILVALEKNLPQKKM